MCAAYLCAVICWRLWVRCVARLATDRQSTWAGIRLQHARIPPTRNKPAGRTTVVDGKPVYTTGCRKKTGLRMNAHTIPDWSQAPEGWHWLAQDEDGRWFWYGVQPRPNIGGGVWRAPSRAQQLAGQGAPNPQWYNTLQQRPGLS